MRTAEIQIEKLAFGGAGFGRIAGKACFVPFTVPGDLARIRVRKEKGAYCEGELVELISAAPQRVTPPCPIFGVCGGCDWQHIPYHLQLAAKEQIFAEMLRRIGRIENAAVLPIVPAPHPFGYRSRIQLKLRFTDKGLQIGFYRTGSHYVVALPGSCAIASPVLNQFIKELGTELAGFPEPAKVPQVDLAIGDDDALIAVIHYLGESPEEVARWLADHLASAAGLFLQSGRKATMRKVRGIDALHYTLPAGLLPGLPNMSLSFSAGGFSQVNYHQNRALIRTVFECCGFTGQERVLELYAGNGNFTLPLARYAREIVALESYSGSVADARRNAVQAGVQNVRFEAADAGEGVEALAAVGEAFDIVLLDPPRSGAPQAVKAVAGLQPAKVVYISCDPSTLARDLGLLARRGYRLVRSVPVDMFPQTYHLESVSLLEKIPAQRS